MSAGPKPLTKEAIERRADPKLHRAFMSSLQHRLEITAEPVDRFGRCRVVAFLDKNEIHVDQFPVDEEFRRTKFVLAAYLAATGEEAGDGVDLRWLTRKVLDAAELSHAHARADKIVPVSIGQLIADHPTLAEPVIDGLLRRGETGNIIAASKVGKSWLAYQIALSVASGGDWLGYFRCTKGRVLLVDNELAPAVIAHRIPKVAEALGIPAHAYHDNLDVVSLRGQRADLNSIGSLIERIEYGRYVLALGDAWYRFIPSGVSENDNAQIMGLYNLLDSYTARMGCAWLSVHHTSKGLQGDKSVVDTGAGAGSQSRAADTHIVLRPHEEDGLVVLDAAVRSFAPVTPLALRWDFPIWTPEVGIDTSALKGRLSRSDERQQERDAEGRASILAALDQGPATIRELRRRTGGMGKGRVERLIYSLEAEGAITSTDVTVRGNSCQEYSIAERPIWGVVYDDRTT